jgi:hypothetical protein
MTVASTCLIVVGSGAISLCVVLTTLGLPEPVNWYKDRVAEPPQYPSVYGWSGHAKAHSPMER